MTDMLQKSENVANNVANKNSQDLTEQWKKGELPEGYYYIKTGSETNIDEYIQWYKDHGIPSEKSFAYFNVQQVLAEVPDYVEWRNMVNCACEEHEANKLLIEENAQLKEDYKRMGKLLQKMEESDNAREKFQNAQIEKLKELLMQSRIYVKIDTEDYEDRTVSKAEKAEARKLLTKIDEVLK